MQGTPLSGRQFEGLSGIAGSKYSEEFRGETDGELWNNFWIDDVGCSAQSLSNRWALCRHNQKIMQGCYSKRPQRRTRVVPTQKDSGDWGGVQRDVVVSRDHDDGNLMLNLAVGEINYPAPGVGGCH